MRPNRYLALLVGFFTILPTIYSLVFICIAAQTALALSSGGRPPETLRHLAVVHVGITLLMLPLAVFYIVHAFNNPALKDDKRLVWVVILFMGLPISAPIYWWLYIWRIPPMMVTGRTT
jgi:hypothetical protein